MVTIELCFLLCLIVFLFGVACGIGIGIKAEEKQRQAEKLTQEIANGVIAPPCKVGDDVYWIDTETNEIKCAKNDIKAVCYYGEGKFKVIVQDENTPEDIGTEWCMLTKEQAEEKLKELGK